MSCFTNGTSQTENYTVQNNSPLFMQKKITVTKKKLDATQADWEKQDKMLQR
jgi:hypothetical protein